MGLVAAGREQAAQDRANATGLLHGFVRDVDEGRHRRVQGKEGGNWFGDPLPSRRTVLTILTAYRSPPQIVGQRYAFMDLHT